MDKIYNELKEQYGEVLNTSELQDKYEVLSFCLGVCCIVVRKADRVKGLLSFTHSPRYYYNFKPE